MNRFTCDCGKSMQMPAQYIGKRVQCRQCGAAFTVAAGQGDIGDVSGLPRLTITAAPNRVDERIMLAGDQPITFGKSRDADVQIDHPTISRKHGRLRPHPHGWVIDDTDSTNGVIINGLLTKSHQLAHGDIVLIGDVELTYSDLSHARAPVAAVGEPQVAQATGSAVPLVDLDEYDDDGDDDGYQLAMEPGGLDESALEPEDLQPVAHIAAVPVASAAPAARAAPAPQRQRRPDDVECDGCDAYLPAGSVVCTRCGTNLQSGRPIVMSVGLDVEELYERAHAVIAPFSWFSWTGLFPFASDAGGSHKPIAIWTVAALTCLVSFWYFTVDDSPAMQRQKELMLWPTSPGEPDAMQLYYLYTETKFGDTDAFIAKYEQLEAEVEKQEAAEGEGEAVETAKTPEAPIDEFDFEDYYVLPSEELIVAAHHALQPQQRAIGEFRWYQLLTHALLHGSFMHLAGNMLFMFVFGTRVNALVGSAATAVIYPVLGICAAVAHMISSAGQPAVPMLGASGAIMGLAGMYFVLFPVQHVHMAIWLRFFVALWLKMFAVRGFWVLAFYIGQDILFSSLGSNTGTAHWAHLGGFIAGMVIGLMLLLARIVSVQGDLLSVVLGRAAWGLVGRPGDRQRRPTLSWGVFGGSAKA